MKKNFLIVLLAGVSMVANAQTIEINRKNEAKIYDAFNSGNFNELDKYIAKDAIEHGLPANANGLEGTKAMFKSFKDAFPDGKITVLETIAEGDYMMIYSEFTGTNKGSFMGMPASNKWVKIKSMDLVKFDKMGKAIEHWGQDDNLAMMQQLGIAPAAQALPEIPLTLASNNSMVKTTSEQNKMTSAKFFDLFAPGNIDKELALLTPDFKIWWNSEASEHGAGTYKMLGETYLKAFPNCKWKATLQLAEGDKVASVTTYEGTQTGELMGIPASGKSMNTKGYIIDYYKNGKIAKRVHLADDLTMLKQIGAIPSDKQ